MRLSDSVQEVEHLRELQAVVGSLDVQENAADYGTYANVLQWCGKLQALDEGRKLRRIIERHGLQHNLILGNHSLNMFAKCGSPEDAQRLFDVMPQRNYVTWTGLLSAYAQNGHHGETVHVMRAMVAEGVAIDNVAYVTALSACCDPAAYVDGSTIHGFITQRGCMESDTVVANALLNMYNKCGSLHNARKVFSKMKYRNVISWTAIISAYANHGSVRDALMHFKLMQLVGVKPNKVTMITLLNTCCCWPWTLDSGRLVHTWLTDGGYHTDTVVSNSIVSMYGRCGSLEEARCMFEAMGTKRDVYSWNIMLSAYAQADRGRDAIELFETMQIKADVITYVVVLNACTGTEDATTGRLVHSQIVKDGLESNVVIGNSLVTMYGKCGLPLDARKVFDGMQHRNVVSWTAIISAYAHAKLGDGAFELFREMQRHPEVEADVVAFTTILHACADLSALQEGEYVYNTLVQRSLGRDPVVGTAMVNLYSKCGNLVQARRIFEEVRRPELALWNTMLAGYANLGGNHEALQLFATMEVEGVKPDKYTLVSVLQACSHGGMVDHGKALFRSMGEYKNVTIAMEHYGCIIDMLGRGGRLADAEEVIRKMPYKPDIVVWTSLLGACRNHGDGKRAKVVAQKCLLLDPKCSFAYITLSNMFAERGKWTAVVRLRKLMFERGLKREDGTSAIEIDRKLHEFKDSQILPTGKAAALDRTHPKSEEIHSTLANLMKKMRKAGYVPDTTSVLHMAEEAEKVKVVCAHSERLAIALGIISTESGTPLRIIKNIRVCRDCHTAAKFISNITQREIVVRDSSKFHLFKDGKCSCLDYW